MPADKYGFKPTPAQMSFGELVLRVAGANPSAHREEVRRVRMRHPPEPVPQ
jgi:hypothetical protein